MGEGKIYLEFIIIFLVNQHDRKMFPSGCRSTITQMEIRLYQSLSNIYNFTWLYMIDATAYEYFNSVFCKTVSLYWYLYNILQNSVYIWLYSSAIRFHVMSPSCHLYPSQCITVWYSNELSKQYAVLLVKRKKMLFNYRIVSVSLYELWKFIWSLILTGALLLSKNCAIFHYHTLVFRNQNLHCVIIIVHRIIEILTIKILFLLQHQIYIMCYGLINVKGKKENSYNSLIHLTL